MKKYCCFLLISTMLFSAFGQNESITESSKEAHFQRLMDSSEVYYNNGDYRKDLALNFKLLKLALEIDKPYYLHKGYRNLAYDYLILGDTISAKESFKKSETQAHLSKNDTATAHIYMDLANIYSISAVTVDEALRYHDKSIELFEKLNDSVGLAKAHYNTILTALEYEKFNEAYVQIIKARKYVDHGDPTYALSLDNLLGQYHYYNKQFKMADSYFSKVINEADKKEHLILLEDSYYYYSESLYEQKKFKEAFDARTEYEHYFETNQQKNISSEIEVASVDYQISEYRKDVKAAELENQLQAVIVKNKSNLNTFLLIVSTFFIILFVTLYFAYRKRKELVNELKIKNEESLKAKEHSEKMSKAKSKFFSTVSHELRTPLYGVIGLSTILLEDKSLKKHEEDLKSLKFSADYLLALINDVLQINKIESNNLGDQRTSFNLRELADKISSSFEYMRIQNKNRIHVHISDNIPKYIKGNRVRLSQILMNLLGNACKFTERGDIYLIAETVNSSENETTIKFYVKDTGIGIPRDKQESIFQEFSQLNSANYNYQGTGLGLPIVKKLLGLSNSEIHVESELGKGSMFFFELTFEATAKKEKKKEEATILDTSILENKRILIVEDNRINQTVTKKILEKSKVNCTIAENGLEAIDKVKRSDFDLILMDINMPLKNGIEASEEIRLFNPRIPIVALTAIEVEEMRQKIYDSGMNDIIVKPYDVTKFMQTILQNMVSADNKSIQDRSARLRAV